MLRRIFGRTDKMNRKEERRSSNPSRLNSFNPRINAKKREACHQVIIKQGYLLKLPEPSKLGSSLKRPVKKWLVFGSLDRSLPFLDVYSNEEACFAGVPESTVDLRYCVCLLSNQIHPGVSECVFTIVLKDKRISLASNSRTVMQEWCCSIERNLKKIGILDSVGGENDYCVVPRKTTEEFRTRSLPPLPLEVQRNDPDPDDDDNNNYNGNYDNSNSNYDANDREYQSVSVGPYGNVIESGLYMPMLPAASKKKEEERDDEYIGPSGARRPSPGRTNTDVIYLHAVTRCDFSTDDDEEGGVGSSPGRASPVVSSSFNLTESSASTSDGNKNGEDLSSDPLVILPRGISPVGGFSASMWIDRCLQIVDKIDSRDPILVTFPGSLKIKVLFNFFQYDGAAWLVGKFSNKSKASEGIEGGEVLCSIDDHHGTARLASVAEKTHRCIVKKSQSAKLVLIRHEVGKNVSSAKGYFDKLEHSTIPRTLKVRHFIPHGRVTESKLSSGNIGIGCNWYLAEISHVMQVEEVKNYENISSDSWSNPASDYLNTN